MDVNEMVLEQYFSENGDLIYIVTRHIFTNEYSFKIPHKKDFKTISTSFQGDFPKEKRKWIK